MKGDAFEVARRRRAFLRAVLAAAAPLAMAIATPALAQEATSSDSASEARQQYTQGTQAFQAKRYEEAALHFESAANLRTSAVALYTAALAWDLATKPERAADAYARALAAPGLDSKQSGLAKDRLAQLERTFGTLLVTAPDSYRVQLDTFSEVVTPARLHGAAGVRSLSIRAPGKPIEHRDVTLEAAKVTPLELKETPKVIARPESDPPKAHPAPPAPMPVAVRDPFWITRRVIGVGVGAVGVATLATAIGLGLSANSAKKVYDAGPTRSSFDHASSLQTWTNVTLVTSALLVAGGIALVVLPNPDEGRVRVSFTPAGASMTGSF